VSHFVISLQCDILDIRTGLSDKARLAISVEADDRARALDIAERNLQAAMLIAQRALKEGT